MNMFYHTCERYNYCNIPVLEYILDNISLIAAMSKALCLQQWLNPDQSASSH